MTFYAYKYISDNWPWCRITQNVKCEFRRVYEWSWMLCAQMSHMKRLREYDLSQGWLADMWKSLIPFQGVVGEESGLICAPFLLIWDSGKSKLAWFQSWLVKMYIICWCFLCKLSGTNYIFFLQFERDNRVLHLMLGMQGLLGIIKVGYLVNLGMMILFHFLPSFL